MDLNNTDKSKISRREVILTTGLVIIIIILGGYLLLGTRFSDENKQNNENNELEVDKKATLLPLDDLKRFTLGGKTIKLGTEWNAINYYVNTEGFNLKCAGITDNNCSAVLLSNGVSSFYLSSPTQISILDGPTGFKKTIKLGTKTKAVDFTFEQSDTYVTSYSDQTGEIDIKIYKQIYGCLRENVCLSSGMLPMSQLENEKHVNDFINLVAEISVE